MIERLIAFCFLVLLIPVFLIIALAIYLEDGSPVLFFQKRIGQNYSYFNIIKFRSMKRFTPNVATHLLENPDYYLLNVGRLLRRYSLDELPNIINVINGDMSFVGPRPALFNQLDLMELRIRNGVDKLKPGITGWAQINGRDEIPIRKKVELEKYYLNNKRIDIYFLIIFKTFLKVFKGKGVSH